MSQMTQLADYGVIRVAGADQISYLQGQLTCDLNQLDEKGWLAGCHCDAKGKMWSNFLLSLHEGAICLIMRKGVLKNSLAALQKFGVFAKVEIEDVSDQLKVFGLVGEFTPCDRLGTVIPFREHLTLVLSDEQLTEQSDGANWQLELIKAGWPELEAEAMSGELVPQMLNQTELEAISYKKGCYIGQETVARMKYLGKQKRASFYLSGSASAIKAGDELEVERNGNWRRAGQVVNAVNAEGQWHLLAILPSDATDKESYRLAGEEQSQLKLSTLPYALECQKES